MSDAANSPKLPDQATIESETSWDKYEWQKAIDAFNPAADLEYLGAGRQEVRINAPKAKDVVNACVEAARGQVAEALAPEVVDKATRIIQAENKNR